MLGFAALAEVALAQIPELSSIVPPTDFGPAWRRLLAETDGRFTLNRQAPFDMVWVDPSEEEEAIVIELLRTM